LPLLWFAAGGAAAGYLFLLGYARFYAPERELRVPRFHELLFLVGLALAAVVLGQLVRRVRRLAADYARRADETKGGAA
jgi:K+-sensing histidine kinase KdpD